jgi:hypothetical protein
MSAASIAWNNLTPFLKVGGEPAKVFMLSPLVGQDRALRSVIIYNMIHLLGTLTAFVIAAMLIPLVFDLPSIQRSLCFTVAGIGVLGLMLMLKLPSVGGSRTSAAEESGRMARAIQWLRQSLAEVASFYRDFTLRTFVAALLETAARFFEGLTFFVAFLFLKKPIALGVAALLDVGRTLLDTVFFFVPFQLGSREGSVLFLMQNLFGIPSDGYLTAVLMYRLVEIIWIAFGYSFWIQMGGSVRSRG